MSGTIYQIQDPNSTIQIPTTPILIYALLQTGNLISMLVENPKN